MRRIVTALLLGVAAPAVAAPADDLKAVISDHWSWWLSENPISATSLGVRDYDDKLPDISLAAQDKSAAAAQKLLDRLNAIPEDSRPRKDQPFYHLLAENDQSYYVAYVSEQNLIPDETGEPVGHPDLPDLFGDFENGRYPLQFQLN